MNCPRCQGLVIKLYDDYGSIHNVQVCYYLSCINCGWVQYAKLKDTPAIPPKGSQAQRAEIWGT